MEEETSPAVEEAEAGADAEQKQSNAGECSSLKAEADADAPVQAKGGGQYAPDTLMHTVVAEKDWIQPSFSIGEAFLPENILLSIWAMIVVFGRVWLPAEIHDATAFPFAFLGGVQLSVAFTPFFGLAANMSRTSWVLAGLNNLFWVTMFGGFLDQRSLGIMLAMLLTMPFICCAACRKRMAKRRARMYCGLVLLLAFVQLTTFFVLATMVSIVVPKVTEVFGEFVGGLILPLVSSGYDVIGLQSSIYVNRFLLTVDSPQAVVYCQIYAIRVFSMSIKMAGFMPQLTNPGMTESMIWLRLAGAFLSTTWSGLSERTFFVQRFCNFVLRYPDLMKPEQDSFCRIKANVAIGEWFHVMLSLVFLLPGGAWWARNPKLWLAPCVYLAAEMLVDLVMIQAHRRLYPIEGESWWGTRQRLRCPFQNWPLVQADGGEAYKAAAAAAWLKGDQLDCAKADAIIHPAFQSRWSQHRRFTDKRLSAMLIWGLNSWWLLIGFYLVYGECRVYIPVGHTPNYGTMQPCV